MDEIQADGCVIKRVEQINYLRINTMDNSTIASDVDRCIDYFLCHFNGMYHKFKFLGMKVLQFLLSSYCMSLYGIEKWYDNLESQKQYMRMSVIYHKAVQQI